MFADQALLWDIRVEDLDPVLHKHWLVERVAQWGALTDIKELLGMYSIAEIQSIVAVSRSLDSRTKTFWAAFEEKKIMHEEILPAATNLAWERLRPIAEIRQFVLVGGTALALRFGHRESQDLDFFTNKPFPVVQLENSLRDSLIAADELEIAGRDENTLHLRINHVKVSFLYQAGVHLQNYDLWRGIRIASLDGLIAMKLNAAAGRGDRKDFTDLYCVCQEGLDFGEMLERGFALLPNLNKYHVLRSLVYFDDAEPSPPLRLRRSYDWEDIKRFFTVHVTKYLRDLK